MERIRERIQSRLLRNVIAGGIGVLVFLVGTYIVLRVSGLTQLALTVLGGTGLVGLAVGIAFRDITENLLPQKRSTAHSGPDESEPESPDKPGLIKP